jgi:predicted nucleotidyltransferase
MPELEQVVREAVAGISGISALLVFGSRARGKARPGSDLDVAVLPSRAAERKLQNLSRHRRQKSLAVALAALAPEGRVDVVFLDEAPDTLRQRVMEHGRMVLCRDPAAWQALRVATMKEYGDREWARRVFRQALRQRLLERRPSGRSASARKPLERARRVSGQAWSIPARKVSSKRILPKS